MTHAPLSRIKSLFAVTVAAVLFSFGLAAPAQAQLGEATALFLRIEPDSRSAGMGNAGVALADNANAMFWNPSGLAFQSSTQVGLTHANWLPEFDAGLFYEYLVGTYHVEGIGTFGGNVTYLNLGEIERRDGQGNVLGESRSFEMAIGTSYARKVSERLGLGTTVRYVYSKLTDPASELGIDDGSASTIAFDLGGLYRTKPFSLGGTETIVSAGLNIANMGGYMTYNEDKQPLPMNMRLGYALTFRFDEYNKLTFANDFNKGLVSTDERSRMVARGDSMVTETYREPDPFYESLFTAWGKQPGLQQDGNTEMLSLAEQVTVGMGLEYWYNDLLALRTGYFYEHPENGNREFLNFGAGLRYNIIGVDISYIYTLEDRNPLANTIRFSVLFDFQ